VKQGAVLYVAAEGTHAIRNRVASFRHLYGSNGHSDVPFRVVSRAVNLREGSDGRRLRATIDQLAVDKGQPPRLVVIDTLSRSLAGGDENNAGDMTAFVDMVDHIREHTGAHVMLVHHTGKDPTRGARGHSSLKAAVDTEIKVASGSTQRVAEVTKQRDLASKGAKFPFGLRKVHLGYDNDGAEVSSCVCDSTQDEVVTDPGLSQRDEEVLGKLRQHGPKMTKKELRTTAWPEAKETTQARKLQRAIKALSEAGMVGASDTEVWLA
jgi:RecA-family ATPase